MATEPIILIDRLSPPDRGFKYIICESLFADDIDKLSDLIITKIEKCDSHLSRIEVDISGLNNHFFKPRRLFAACYYFSETIRENNMDTKLAIIVSSEQYETYTEMHNIDGLIVEKVYKVTEEKEDIKEKYARKISNRLKKISPIDIETKVIYPAIIICSFMIYISATYLNKTLIGFVLFVSFAALLYELIIVHRIIQKYYKNITQGRDYISKWIKLGVSTWNK